MQYLFCSIIMISEINLLQKFLSNHDMVWLEVHWKVSARFLQTIPVQIEINHNQIWQQRFFWKAMFLLRFWEIIPGKSVNQSKSEFAARTFWKAMSETHVLKKKVLKNSKTQKSAITRSWSNSGWGTSFELKHAGCAEKLNIQNTNWNKTCTFQKSF